MAELAATAHLERLLAIDPDAEADRIAAWIRAQVRGLRRRGVVIGVSGGVDSAVTAALAARAVGVDRVFALLMPERESDPASTERGLEVVRRFGLAHAIVDITAPLEALGAYAARDAAIAEVVPGYGPGWRSKVVTRGPESGGFGQLALVTEDPNGHRREVRLDSRTQRAIVAATNCKQRVRKLVEYQHAERLHHAVAGTPNLLEYELGFFVRGGDGLADLKPIAHLYKSQVYRLAEALGVPASVRRARPSTDTYTLPQGQDEFHFVLDHRRLDLLLAGLRAGFSDAALLAATGLDPDRLAFLKDDIARKRALARELDRPALVPPPSSQAPGVGPSGRGPDRCDRTRDAPAGG
ncbi:MAG: NAD(+) synthase [Sphingomonadaceae bacterium]|uniref:NAD(+) synthase n=1 Tax=Thermaurantiacus sp. TaxID=2820283 RepID=UPI00298F162A|nr:NAD(+) synthase [Thermaurantiacus sp.]MCS6986291.1 NAD(+) synthase [Sphingomonadaceae bacterium]MDW8415740.1 NAD(+) synthase [Thermaurantiacus sp.]